MGQKLPPDQLALYQRIDLILLKDWDPIGIGNEPGSRDEYYSYLPHVFRLALDEASVEQIAEYLDRCTTEAIGLQSNLAESRRVARTIKEAHAELVGRNAA